MLGLRRLTSARCGKVNAARYQAILDGAVGWIKKRQNCDNYATCLIGVR